MNVLQLHPAESDFIRICPAVRFDACTGCCRCGGIPIEGDRRRLAVVARNVHAADRDRVLAIRQRGQIYHMPGIGGLGPSGGEVCSAVKRQFHTGKLVEIVDAAPGEAQTVILAPAVGNDADRRRCGRCAVDEEVDRLRRAGVARTVYRAEIHYILAVGNAADVDAGAAVTGGGSCVDPTAGAVQGVLDAPASQGCNSLGIRGVKVPNA